MSSLAARTADCASSVARYGRSSRKIARLNWYTLATSGRRSRSFSGSGRMDDKRQQLVTTLTKDRETAAASPSPFYAALLERMLEDVEACGPTWTLLEPYATEPAAAWYAFRALSGVHYEVLAGKRPDLARHYPCVGGDGDAAAAWPAVRDAFANQDPEVLADLRHPLQTNETSRCGALIG